MDLLLSVFTLKRYALRVTHYALRKPVLHQDSLVKSFFFFFSAVHIEFGYWNLLR